MPSHPADTDKILLIARSIAGETGHALLTSLVAALGQHLNAAFVAVTYGEGTPPTHARTLYALEDNAVSEDIRYALDGTPCNLVYRGDTLTIPCGIADVYPKEKEFEGYIGIPLRDVSGLVSGHLAVFSQDPIRNAELATAITRIFALRAEAELRRLAQDKERQALIDDLTALNARMQGGYARLRRESIQKTGLMGLIAHDLRSPLSAILSQAELGRARLAATSKDLDKLDIGFQKIIDNADRMAGLIKATLERARHDSATVQISAEACNLSGLVRIAVEANQPEAARKGIALDAAAMSDIIAEVDDALIVSAIDNLVSNALKYTHAGGHVRVTMSTAEDTARISVTDTGQGLTDSDLERAFGRFQRLSATPTGGEPSIGLGLANVREIAQAHGGSVQAESEGRDRGSCFSLVIPLAGAAPPDTAT